MHFVFVSRMAFYLDRVLACTRVLMRAISGWIARHLIGAVLVSLPAIAVFSHVTCDMQHSTEVSGHHPPLAIGLIDEHERKKF